MNKFGLILITLIALMQFAACDMYEKVLRGGNFDQKIAYAKKYYNTDQYERAAPLLEEVIAYNKGTKDVSDYYYYYAYSYYGMAEYLSASFYFKQFYTNYPQSKYAENAMYMAAYCYYKVTPESQLDQTYTQQAIDMLQNFALTYQESIYFNKSLELMKDLRNRLEKKDADAAKLYYKTENYKAAAITFSNLLNDYPDTPNKEQFSYMIVKSKYQVATKSISEKKNERITAAINEYTSFLKAYPNSKYTKELGDLYLSLRNQQNKIKPI